ncbi:MAG: hypothetical protein JWL95_1715 [Gemmatimonadetes bacterium]|nr:hypothetical protein [Gemmatimonadota bacterium]
MTLRSMSRWVAIVALLLAPARAGAQLYGRNIELFGTIGGVAGLTPVSVASRTRLGAHGGFRADGGIQGSRFGAGLGARVWELVPTTEYGGHGLEGFLLGELRVGSGVRTTIRATVGAGFDDIDGGRGPAVDAVGADGFLWSVGVGHEINLQAGRQLLLSADLLSPNIDANLRGRRAPVMELGVAYRVRQYNSIGPLRSRRR